MHNQSAPPIAVVTPVFNGQGCLAETTEGVPALNYPNLVRVVLNNASTEATPAIIARYRARQVPLPTGRNETTRPMVANRSTAVAMVPPEPGYFRVLCADGTHCRKAIAHPVETAERDPTVGLVGCLWRAGGLCGKELPAGRGLFDGTDVMLGHLRREHICSVGHPHASSASPGRSPPSFPRSVTGKLRQRGEYAPVHTVEMRLRACRARNAANSCE